MVLRFLFWLFGYLKIEIRSLRPERFINAALQQRFVLWHVRRTEQGAEALTGINRFRRIRKVARASRIRPRVISRHGLPFIWRRYSRRKWMLAGPFAFLACLYLFSSVIWFVEVEGNENLSPVMIKQAAAELGLAQGVWRYTLDAYWIGRVLPLKMNELSWASVELTGARAVIRVAEKHMVPEDQKPNLNPVHIVAAKKGSIKEIITKMGSPAVTAGSEVQAGQVLINSYMRSETNFELEQGGEPIYPGQWVHAEGNIIADVTYTQQSEVFFEERVWLPGGVEYERILIRLGNWEWSWGKQAGQDEGKDYCTDQKIWLPAPWRNSILPMEIMLTRLRELQKSVIMFDEEKALQAADLRAWAALLDRIPPEARILSKQRVHEEIVPGGVRVTWQVVAEEDIGRLQRVSGRELLDYQSEKNKEMLEEPGTPVMTTDFIMK